VDASGCIVQVVMAMLARCWCRHEGWRLSVWWWWESRKT